jgi:predicted nucleotidyltransferase
MNLTELRELLSVQREKLTDLGVATLFVFGSVARGEAGPDSDVDLLVEFSRPVGLIEFVRVQQFLARTLGRRVDLVTRDALRPGMRDEILKELVDAA